MRFEGSRKEALLKTAPVSRRLPLVLVAVLVLGTGCASIQSNIGSKHRDQHGMPSQFGHEFSGVVSSLGGWCYFNSPNMEHAHIRYAVAPVLFVFSVVDLALTIVADALLLPFELFSEPENSRLSLSDECDYSKLDLVGDD